jgi:hypothetical protein
MVNFQEKIALPKFFEDLDVLHYKDIEQFTVVMQLKIFLSTR